MTYNEYWYESHERVIAYRLAEYKRTSKRNEELWLQGLYIYNAFGVVLKNAFANKGATPLNYLEQPLNIFPKTAKELEEERRKEQEKAIRELDAWAKRWQETNGR